MHTICLVRPLSLSTLASHCCFRSRSHSRSRSRVCSILLTLTSALTQKNISSRLLSLSQSIACVLFILYSSLSPSVYSCALFISLFHWLCAYFNFDHCLVYLSFFVYVVYSVVPVIHRPDCMNRTRFELAAYNNSS
jgi:hypothetical protein